MLAALLLHTPVTRREGIALALQVLAIAILVDPFHMTMDPVGVAACWCAWSATACTPWAARN